MTSGIVIPIAATEKIEKRESGQLICFILHDNKNAVN